MAPRLAGEPAVQRRFEHKGRLRALSIGLRSAARAIGRLSGWQRFIVAILAGGLSVLAMAPVFAWPILFFTLPVLVWLLDGAGPALKPARTDTTNLGFATASDRKCIGPNRIGPNRIERRALWRAAKDGWAFAFGYFFFGLFWIGEAFLVEAEIFGVLLPFAITIMPGGLALFWAAATAAASLAWSKNASRIIVLAITLSLAEYLRGLILTGFPWNVIGYALTYPLVLMQSAGLLGIYALSAIVVIVFSAPLVLLAGPQPDGLSLRRRAALGVATAMLPLAALVTYGVVQLATPVAPPVDGVRLRIVQPATPQRDKWLAEKQGAIFNEHLRLSRTNPAGRLDDMAGITHLIWSEAAMPFLPLSSPRALEMIADLLPSGTHLLAGALRVTNASDERVDIYSDAPGRRRAYNSLMVFDGDAALVRLYDKIHLVPFGEYLPFQEALEAIGLQQLTRVRGGFTPGSPPRSPIAVPGLPAIAPLICYEAIFPGAMFSGDKRPGVLLNVTNDGWFGTISGPYQHFHQSRVRAVEEGIPLVRASNNGVSAVIDPYGRIVARLGLNRIGTIDSGVPRTINKPMYSRHGNLIFLSVVFSLAVMVSTLSRLRIMKR